MLEREKRGVQNVYNGSFQDFEFNSHSIRVCGLFDVIEHIEDDISFLNKLYEKLPENGIVMINVPSLNFLWADADVHAGITEDIIKKTLNGLKDSLNLR